jgi:hypothetical protein
MVSCRANRSLQLIARIGERSHPVGSGPCPSSGPSCECTPLSHNGKRSVQKRSGAAVVLRAVLTGRKHPLDNRNEARLDMLAIVVGSTLTMTILYDSIAVRKAVVKLFSDPSDRRVAISAFVGDGAEAFLPFPQDIELICWPNPTGSNPSAIRRLLAKGVDVRFSDSLHMKIYWSSRGGAVVTSANLSTNALGAGGLKEVGVRLPPGELNIQRILSALKMRSVTPAELDLLDRERDRYVVRTQMLHPKVSRRDSFPDWYESPMRKRWLLGCWGDPTFVLGEATRDVLKAQHGVKSAHLYLTARKVGFTTMSG